MPHHFIEVCHTSVEVASAAKQYISFQCSAAVRSWATLSPSKWQRSIFRLADYLHKNMRIIQQRSRQMSRFDSIRFGLCRRDFQWERVFFSFFFSWNTRLDCVTDPKLCPITVFCLRFRGAKYCFITCHMLQKWKALFCALKQHALQERLKIQ